MNAKLIVVLVATLAAAPAFAEQKFGRDSVYASGEVAMKSPAVAAAAPARLGRDSVYAVGVKPSTPMTAGATVAKFGRA